MKNKKLLVIYVAILPLILSSCYKDPGKVDFSINQVGNVSIHTSFQQEYIDFEDSEKYVKDHMDELSTFSNSTPNKVVISYDLKSDNGSEPKSVTVKLSEKEDMSDSISYKGDKKETSIYNLKIDTTYYYQVEANYVSTFKSEISSFKVTDTVIRNLDIEGVENCRDLGGWDIGENRIYKQGMLYRTAQFNYGGKYNDYVSAPTEKGKNSLLNELKIKTEIDLRRTKAANNYDEVNGITSSPLGNKVKYISCPMLFGGKNIYAVKENKESLKLFFETLSDENNYPIAFHCLRGTDRTGGLAYVLGAIMGMNENDLIKDYLFSNFANIGSAVYKSGIAGLYVRGINDTEGDTYQEKAKNYLLANVDISEETINKIINILVKQA